MNTKDLSKFGHRELKIAGQLLTAIHTDKDKTKLLGNEIQLEFNMMSCNVFLVDEEYNVAMLNDDILEDWITCPNCGHEDFYSEFLKSSTADCCKEYFPKH